MSIYYTSSQERAEDRVRELEAQVKRLREVVRQWEERFDRWQDWRTTEVAFTDPAARLAFDEDQP